MDHGHLWRYSNRSWDGKLRSGLCVEVLFVSDLIQDQIPTNYCLIMIQMYIYICFDCLPHMQCICQSSYLLSCLPTCLFLSPSTKLFSTIFLSILASITISSSLLHLPHSKSILTVHHVPFCFLSSHYVETKKTRTRSKFAKKSRCC